ncbi:UNVERIFIED_CONTAM: hypothetical protein K2H54_054244 [Gekko kuhli]
MENSEPRKYMKEKQLKSCRLVDQLTSGTGRIQRVRKYGRLPATVVYSDGPKTSHLDSYTLHFRRRKLDNGDGKAFK